MQISVHFIRIISSISVVSQLYVATGDLALCILTDFSMEWEYFS